MEAELSADKKVEQLSEEELHCVLKQLTDHNLPERDKCPLVQRLNAEEKLSAKNNNSYSSTGDRTPNRSTEKLRSRMHGLRTDGDWDGNGGMDGGGGGGCCGGGDSKCLSQHVNEAASESESSGGDKAVNYAVNYAQSLHEPPRTNTNCDDSQNLRAAISNNRTEIVASASHLRSGGSNRKPNRANSFTMPSQSDNSSKSGSSTLKILDHRLINGTDGEVSPETLRGTDKQALDGSLPYRNHKSASSIVNSTSPLPSCSNSSHSPSDTSADHFNLSNKSTSLTNYSSVHLASISSLVDSINSDSVPNYPRLLSDSRNLKSNNQSLTVQEEDEEKLEFGEMKELQSQAKFIEYRRNLNLSLSDPREEHHVDKAIEIPMLSAGGGLSDENAYSNYQGLSNNPSMPSLHSSSILNSSSGLNNNSINNSNGNKQFNKKNKKSRKGLKEDVKMSQDFEGFIGYIEDVDVLEEFVNNANTSNHISAVIDKKIREQSQKGESEPGKRPSKRNNGEIKSTSEEKSVVTSSNNNKVPLSSVSNSSSLSGDDTTTTSAVVKNSKHNTSPELPNGSFQKKSKTKNNKQDKNNNKVNNRKNTTVANEKENCKGPGTGKSSKDDKNDKGHSSTDATDTEEDTDVPAVPYRLMKSNSLLPAKTVDTSPEEADNLCSVSDSEMADREKGWDTPKQKKKKKAQQAKFQQANQNAVSNHPNAKHPGNKNFNSNAVHNLARGYESEREYSLNPYLNANSFVAQSLSTSMHAISSRVFDKRPGCNLSPPTNPDSLLSPPADEFLDSDFMELHSTPCDTQDSGPKMPSYADIAKSFNQPASTSRSVATVTTIAAPGVTSSSTSTASTTIGSKPPPSQVTNNTSSSVPATAEEFPQLNPRSPDAASLSVAVTAFLASSSTSNSMDMLPASAFEAINEEKQSTPTVSPDKSDESSKNEPADSVLDSSSTCATSAPAYSNKEDVESPNGTRGFPTISFGDSGESSFADEDNTFDCDQPAQNYVNGENKLVFGFFDDSELSMMEETDFCPLDHAILCSQNSHFPITNLMNADLNGDKADLNAINSTTHLEENFFKNAVHVNDLEDHYRKLDDQQCEAVQPQPSHKAAYSSSASSPLTSSFDSSPASSTVAVSTSSSAQSNTTTDSGASPRKPFVSCVGELSNYRFIDNVDQNSYNYSSIIQYVYKSWNQCHVGA